VRWFISGYHIRPTGVKKPYNPILGECCRAEWDHGEQGRTLFVAEQTSHHPPVSAFYFVNPRCNLVVEGDVKPKSRFLLNSVASLMEGFMSIRLLNLEEEYVITFPSYYVRGLFLGTLKMELSGKGTITCAKSGLSCELEFKNKGMFGRGSNNAVAGDVVQNKKCVATIEGNWDSVVRWGLGSKADRVLLDVSPSASPVSQKIIAPVGEQMPHESRRLWARVSEAIRARDMDTATSHKLALEDSQREGGKQREASKEVWHPIMFSDDGRGNYRFRLPYKMRYDPSQEAQIQEYVASFQALASSGRLSCACPP